MKNKINTIIIAKDGFPLEQFENSPIINFFRRVLLSSHKECRNCYNSRVQMKESTRKISQTLAPRSL